MVTRSASQDSSTSNTNSFETPEMDDFVQPVVFVGGDPQCWAMLYIDGDGNTKEASSSPSTVFGKRACEEFANARDLAIQENPQLCPPGRLALKIGDTDEVTAYYKSIFTRLQQQNCRMLAKNFIKLIHPRKQVLHPYNGGERGDPELTKPEWWPRDVIHKEPDHLQKEQRLKLLVHIVQQTRFSAEGTSAKGFSVDELEEVADPNQRALKPTSKFWMLSELFRVRRIEEKFERNEVDADKLVYVIDYKTAKKTKAESNDEPKDEPKESRTPSKSPNLNFWTPEGQIPQPNIGHQCLATATTPIPAQVMTANKFPHPCQQSMDYLVQPHMKMENSFSEQSLAFQQSNMFAPHYCRVNNQLMADQAYTAAPIPWPMPFYTP